MPSFSQCHLTSSLPQLLFGSSSTLYGFSLYLTSCDLKCIWFVFEFMMGFLVTMLSSFSIFFVYYCYLKTFYSASSDASINLLTMLDLQCNSVFFIFFNSFMREVVSYRNQSHGLQHKTARYVAFGGKN